MSRIKWERFKFYVLVALILISLVQVGILWDYQNHGFPYYFFGGFLKNKESFNTVSDRSEFFSPYRIIISDGYDEVHGVIEKDDSMFAKLFGDMKLYLVDILRLERIKSRQAQPLTEDVLGNLASKPSVTFEFKTDISKRLLAYFLDIKDVSNDEMANIKKIIILPEADANSNCTIEIVDDVDQKIFEYVLPFQNTGREKEYYVNLIDTLSKNPDLMSYKIFNELHIPKEKLKGIQIGEDVLFVARHLNKYKKYDTIDAYPPEEFEIKNNSNPKELMDLADTILLNETDIYIPSIDIYGAAVFKNPDSVYRVYKDGLLEYNYSSPAQEEIEKGDISEAFTRTLNFINSKRRLVTGAELYLSGVRETKDRYIFTFDYSVDEIPVFFNYQAEDKEKKLLKNAVTIEAAGERILNCWWIFKDFVRKHENEYNVYFEVLLNDLYTERNLSIKNIGVCYKVTRTNSQDIEPAWLIEPADNTDPYTVNMRKR